MWFGNNRELPSNPLFRYVSAHIGGDPKVYKGLVKHAPLSEIDEWNAQSVRNFFFKGMNPEYYRNGQFDRLYLPYYINSLGRAGAHTTLLQPFFSMPHEYLSRVFSPEKIRSARERGITRSLLNGRVFVVTGDVHKGQDTIVDFVLPERIRPFLELLKP